ncbi:MAG: hypothetical protein HYS13_16170 [Planctomycetia bacterium]|nr:hypothetical protein [Planctomycetia bacterium]
MRTEKSNAKAEALRLIAALPDDATWDDVMYRLYVGRAIEAGLRDAEAGNFVEMSEVRRQFGLPE